VPGLADHGRRDAPGHGQAVDGHPQRFTQQKVQLRRDQSKLRQYGPDAVEVGGALGLDASRKVWIRSWAA